MMKIETRAVHAGRHIDPATGAVTQPIHLSTTFERTAEGEYPLGFSYSREDNPNRRALEECLADLEGGKEALVFSSGLAVATALVQGLEPGDHIVAPDDVYWGLRKVIGDVFGKCGPGDHVRGHDRTSTMSAPRCARTRAWSGSRRRRTRS